MKKLLLTLGLAFAAQAACATEWSDPYLDRVRDLDTATLERLHAQRDMPATVQLAYEMMAERRFDRGYELIGMAADANVPAAQYLLGTWLWYCLGGCRDKQRAIELFERAVQAGHPVAHERLADIYNRDTKFAKKDDARAYALYLAGAKHGFVSSMASVAIKLCAGEGVGKDVKAGRAWADLAQKDQLAKLSYEDFGC